MLQLLSAEETGIDFQNRIIETAENNINNNINQYNGGGVAIADVNNDNLPDIYFVCTNGKNKLYLNQGNLKFKAITDAAGLGSEDGFETAVTAADVNADGFLDFYVCRAGPINNAERVCKLYINNGLSKDGAVTFSEKAKEYGIMGGVVVKKINSSGALYDQTRMKDGFVILKVNDRDVNNVDEMRKIIGNEKSITISGFYPGYDGLYEYPITLE